MTLLLYCGMVGGWGMANLKLVQMIATRFNANLCNANLVLEPGEGALHKLSEVRFRLDCVVPPVGFVQAERQRSQKCGRGAGT